VALSFDWHRGLHLRAKAEGDVTFTPAVVEALSLFDGSSASYGTVYRRLPPVRTVVDFLANAVADTPLKFYRRTNGGREEVTDHRIVNLIRRPSSGLTEFRLKFGWVADVAVYGQSYTHIGSLRGRDELVPLPPPNVAPKGGVWTAPSGFDVTPPGGPTTRVDANEILHMHTYDPEDRRIGSSKLAALKAILQEEIEASRNRSGFWKNAARTGGWIEFPFEAGMLTPDQLDRLRESMQGSYGGADNSGKTGIIERGGKFNRDGFSPKDSEFLAGRLFVLEQTARVFNMPLALLSLTQTATYASQREFHKQLYMDVLPPWYKMICDEIELQLFPLFADTENLYCEFVPDAKLWGDPIDRVDVLNKAIGRPWMVVREGRKLENLPDRGEPDDDKLAIPVGPNLALEGSAPAAPAQLSLVPEEEAR
jgi:HK97 family phage portal protein